MLHPNEKKLRLMQKKPRSRGCKYHTRRDIETTGPKTKIHIFRFVQILSRFNPKFPKLYNIR
jgi:hypothetical protein